jgi:hypothetical protein
MSKPKLALIPSGYKSGKVYSILPNDATGDFDFDRASGGTRVRKDGLIEEMQTYGENELLNSDFNTTDNWVINGATGTVIENGYARIFTSGAYTEIYQAGTSIVANELYRLDYEVISNDGGNLGVVAYSGLTQLLPSTVGKHSVEFLGNNTTLAIKRYSGSGTTDIKIAYAKVYKINFNVPRLDWYNSNCPSLLLEPQRTNYALNSTQMHENNTLTASGSTITKTGNYALAPDGTFTATRLQCTGTGSGYALLSVNKTNPSTDLDANGYYMSSVYVRSNTGTTQTIGFYGSSTQTSQSHEIGTEWERIQFLAYRPALSKYAYIGYASTISGVEADLDFLVWGGQTEIVDSYITSFIPTGVSTVTRLKDDCHLLNHTLFTDYPFTVYAKAKIEDVGNTIFSIYGGASNKYLAFLLSSSTQVAVYRRDATNNDSDFYNFTYSVGDTIKVAVAFINDTTYKLYINGTEIADVTSGLSVPFDNNDILLGQFRISGDDGRRNSIDDFRVYDYTLTDAELTELTTL